MSLRNRKSASQPATESNENTPPLTEPEYDPKMDYSDREYDSKELTESDKPTEEKPKEPVTIKKVIIRSLTATLLASIYLSILNAGHLYCIIAVVLTQTELYKEIVNVRYVATREQSMPWFRTLQWAWFFIAMFFVYGETLHRFFVEHKSLGQFLPFTENLNYIVYCLYWILVITAVLTLKPGMIRFQISQHMWSIVTVCIVVFQCKYFPAMTLNGLFWYFFPMSIVIMNDVSAYFVGITCGKKFISAPFLALSPNKTWEGFIGAFVCTMIFSFFFPALLAKFTWFICPADGLHVWPFPPPLQCDPNPVFIARFYELPYLGDVLIYPIQWHGLVYGLFASLVAPFGGFFASAIKRAYNKKDFDSFMPGHGGMMDRMDCQLLMMTFNSFYYYQFIAPNANLSVERMLYLAAKMTPENRLKLWNELGHQIGQITNSAST